MALASGLRTRDLGGSATTGEVGAAICKQIADRDYLDIWMILKSEFGAKFTKTESDNSHANLTIGNRLPGLGKIRDIL